MAKLGDVCSLITDGSHFSPKDIGTGYPMLSVKDMKEKDFSFDGCKHISEEDYQTLLRNGCQPKKGDVLLAKDGSYFKYAFIVEEERELAVLSSIAILRPKVDIIDPRYLREFLMADSTYKTVSLNYISGTALKRVILQGIKKINVPLPAIEDQRKIAEKFIKLDQLIALRKEQLAKLNQLVKSRFIELFGDCNKQTSIKESGLTISDGNYSSKYPRSEEFVESGIPFIRANNLKNGTVVDEDMYFITPEKHAILLKGHLKFNDVLITTRGNIGQVAIVPDKHNDSNINAQIVLLRDEHGRFVPQYLLWALQTEEVKSQYIELQTGTALKQLPVGRLEQVVIKEPPIELQKRFAAFVEQIDKSKLAIQQSLDKLELLKKSLTQEYFG